MTAAGTDELPTELVRHAAKAAGRDLDEMQAEHRLSTETATAVVAAGFARHFVPREFGGTAGRFSSLVSASAELARTCASTAWCATLYAAHGRLAAHLPAAGQRALWGDSPDVPIAASIMPPQGEAERTATGWRIRGRWAFASGVDHAAWLLLACRTQDAGRPEHRILAVPRSEVEVLDTWRSLGMRATGSHAVEVAGSDVPTHLTLTLDDLARPRPDADRCHAVPYLLVGALMFAAPVLGAARAALDEWSVDQAAGRADGSAAGRSAEVERVLARSSAEIDAAQLLLERAADLADHGTVTDLLVARNRRDAVEAARMCAAATDRLFRAGGSRAHAADSVLQRCWRDVSTAASHAALGAQGAAAEYATAVLGA
ncbi:acyl-CoA dehydrogenase family protein [Streptomyces caeruleatus]|uniref:Oxidoreductase n=1 Tax=Streptomyces caeruleatus TaxID=661399 RepID=A0A101TNL8_9ACTN|nr:acyl-CoA dehydrogenase family protein [Streptomyces caeruleatus]KUN95658.1 oxidoreductase [Streptomyces caeruleatus]